MLPLLLLACCAPLPFAKPAPPPVIAGAVYLLHWCEKDETDLGGGDSYGVYTAVFQPSGRFEAWGEGDCFSGRWRVEGGTLHVEESLWHEENDCRAGLKPWRWRWSPGASPGADAPGVWLERVSCRCGSACPNGGCCAACGCAGPKK